MGPIKASLIFALVIFFQYPTEALSDVLIAKGDPNAFDGEGRVYLYEADNLLTPKQVLSPLSTDGARLFGSAIDFIPDINGDGVNDLVVAAPGDALSTAGTVAAFISQSTATGTQYNFCGSIAGDVGLGSAVSGIFAADGALLANLLIATQAGARIDQFIVALAIDGACEFSPVTYALVVAPTPTPAYVVTDLATPLPSLTPENPTFTTPTPSPTPSASPIGGQGGQDGGSINNTEGAAGGNGLSSNFSEAPVVVAPGAEGLPAPEVIKQKGAVEVRMPVVKPQLSGGDLSKANSQLRRRLKISRGRANRLLSDPKNLVVTYIVEYSEIATAQRFAFIQSAYADDTTRTAYRKRQIRSKRNSVTLRNLRPGATYSVSYRVEISLARPRVVLGVTKPSFSVRF
jgi:hypothetical protein